MAAAPREWSVPDDGPPEYVGPDPIGGCAGLVVAALLLVAVVVVLGVVWLVAR